MKKIYRSIAGLDVHQREIVACILHEPVGCRKVTKEIQTFGTTTRELRTLNEWICSEQVEAVVMESTGQYWRPVWNMVNGAFDKILANPHEVKNLRGRKTDRKDAAHMADITMHGLVSGSYIPDEETQEMRLLTRTRYNYQQEMTRNKNQIHAILQTGTIKLTTYLTDIYGKTGRKCIDLLLNGEVITLEKIAALKSRQARASAQQLYDALDGKLTEVQRVILRGLFQAIDEIQTHIDELNSYLAEQTSNHQEVFERLQELPGISARTAEIFMAEVGWNVQAFPTKEHLASWAGLCPESYESGGVRKSAQITKGNRHLKGALGRAALAASRSTDERFRTKYERIKSRSGAQKAMVAVAHQLIKIMYILVKKQEHYDSNFAKKTAPTL